MSSFSFFSFRITDRLRAFRIISRSRKIRCDSTRPICNNCTRRSNECEYDLVPKRRGPDKRPGTRQRSCKKRPADGSTPPRSKRKRTSSDQITELQEISTPRVKEIVQDSKLSPPIRQVDRYTQDPHLSHPHSGLSPTDVRIQTDPTTHYKVCYFIITFPISIGFQQEISSYRRTKSYTYEQDSYVKSSYPRSLDVNAIQFPDTHHRKFPVPTSSGFQTEQKMWWEKILRTHT